METGEVIFFLKDQCLLQQSFFFKGGGGSHWKYFKFKDKIYKSMCKKGLFSSRNISQDLN